MAFVGRPPPAYGLKFLVKAGSPDPVMTRQRWPALTVLPPSTAAGVAALMTAANAAQPAPTATAIEQVVRRLRRIRFPFSPRRAPAAECPETFPALLPGLTGLFNTSRRKTPQIARLNFRNVP